MRVHPADRSEQERTEKIRLQCLATVAGSHFGGTPEEMLELAKKLAEWVMSTDEPLADPLWPKVVAK